MKALFFAILIGALSAETMLLDPKEKPRTAAFTESTYKIRVDISMSPYAGGDTLLAVQRMIERALGWALSTNPVLYSKRAAARAWRLGEEFLIWLPANYFETALQHELYGHGYRLRDLHRVNRAAVHGYDFNVPLPYGPGGAYTSFVISSNYTTSENAAVAAAGVESTAILAILTKLKWVESKKIDPRQVFLYLFSQYDLPLYVGSIDALGDIKGHDMRAYVDSVNYTYPEELLHTGNLQALSCINLADPFTYYALFALFHYISSGKEGPMPMIGGYYLPGFRMGLTPFGSEVFFENFFRLKMPLYAYLKGGRHASNSYYGIGFYGTNFWSQGPFHLGARLDLWLQPKLLLQPGAIPFEEINLNEDPNPETPLYPIWEQRLQRFGGAASLIATFQQSKLLAYELELGGKSRGFLPGYSLRSSLTLRFSTNLIF